MSASIGQRAEELTHDEAWEQYEDEIDGCLHGVPWCDPCWECDFEEDQMEIGVF